MKKWYSNKAAGCCFDMQQRIDSEEMKHSKLKFINYFMFVT